jgi:ribonuclease Z
MATLFLPPEMGRQLPGILSAWQEMSGSKFEYRLIVLHPGAPAPLKNNVAVTPFLLAHEPQTVGFLVEQKVRKLREQFLQLPAEEIVQRKGAEADLLFQDEVRPLFAYVPDTLPEGLDALPEAAWRARVLALECSFLDARKPLEKIRIGRHLHVDDIAQRLPKFSGEHLLLFHFSKLYSPDEVRTLVDARFGDPWRGRVHCLLDAPTS